MGRAQTGSRVHYSTAGPTIRHLTVRPGRAAAISFLGRVLKLTSHGVVLRLGDGHRERLAGRPFRGGAAAPGVTVLITLRLGRPGSTPKVTGVAPSASTGATGTPETSGAVVELDPSALVVQALDGSTRRFTIAPSTLNNLRLSLCDTVDVLYHGAAGTNVADSVKSVNLNVTGPCNGSGGNGGTVTGSQNLVGTITQLTLQGLTISTAQGTSQTFAATMDLTGGYGIGDQVDITSNPGGAVPTATDVEYQDQDEVGTAVYVDPGKITLVDSTSGQRETFTDDPSNGTFDGINVGDKVDVSYHLSALGPVVDAVSDMTNPN